MRSDAELEIGIHRAHAGAHQVELRFTDPISEVEVTPERGTAAFGLSELLTLELDPTAYGQALTDSLLQDDNVRGLYLRAKTVAAASGRSLRIRLLVGSSASELNALRWELLQDPESGTPLAYSERILFSRFLHSHDWRRVELRPQAELKALVAVAAPTDLETYQLSAIDAGAEVERARQSLGGPDGTAIQVDVVGLERPLTSKRLLDRLRPGVDVLYLLCHGALTPQQAPYLLLQDEGGQAAQVAGVELARAIAELRQPPRLAVLASCESAGSGSATTANGQTTAEASLAPLLAEAGIPAILAMQGQISIQTVATALPNFFRELVRDGLIDRALATARSSIRDRQDAWMPVLFLRLKRGQLWRDLANPEPNDDDPSRGEVTQSLELATAVSLKRWPPADLPDHPYPVLLPYSHPELMAGRESEIERIRMLLRLPVSILGLGAASGVGKTSLLAGGLVPVLRGADPAGIFPVSMIRYPHEPGIADRVLSELFEDAPEVPDDDWRQFSKLITRAGRLAEKPPLLVLDQFENVLRPTAHKARARLGPLLAATTQRRSSTDEPLCRWLLAYRLEFHGPLLAWLGDVLQESRAEQNQTSLPYDLTGPDRFQTLTIHPLATPPPTGDPLAEATRVFQAVMEQPLRLRTPSGRHRYPWHFAPGHAQRLARAFAQTRLDRPWAPLAPELQVVLAHLFSKAGTEGRITVPEDPGTLIDQALTHHLQRALERAFPTGAAAAATRRARALLALHEMAKTSDHQGKGLAAEELHRALGEDGASILEQLTSPLTRLVVLRESAEGFHYTLAHERMAEVIQRTVAEEGRQGTLVVNAELLQMRRFVSLQTSLYSSQTALVDDDAAPPRGARRKDPPVVATRTSRRYYRQIEANTDALLWNDEQRAWWTACRAQRAADRRQSTVAAAASLIVLALISGFIWNWADQRQQVETLLERVASSEPKQAFRALDQLLQEPPASVLSSILPTRKAEDHELLTLLKERELPMDALERGLTEIPADDLSATILRVVEMALPWVSEEPENPMLIANLTWALDYGPARNPLFSQQTLELRRLVLAPLRELRPPPKPRPQIPNWIAVSGGRFLMGSPEQEGRDDEHPQHPVTVSGFLIQRHEVTNGDFRRLFPDHRGEQDLPARFVSWYQAYTYAAWLGGRLPTEAEWEFAARASCLTAFCNRSGQAATLDEVAWTEGNSKDPETGRATLSPVMQLEPNPWGIYDLLGSVWEWTADGYGAYPSELRRNPWIPADADLGERVFRGGSYWSPPAGSRAANRSKTAANGKYRFLGFRVVIPDRPDSSSVDQSMPAPKFGSGKATRRPKE